MTIAASRHRRRENDHRKLRWLPIVTIVALLGMAAPGVAQSTTAVVATHESVFNAPGLGRAVSTYEDTVIAGGNETVHVFQRGPTGWAHTATLTPTNGAPGDGFGSAVSLSGDFALIGAPNATVAGHAGAGVAYVFRRLVSGTWVQVARVVADAPSTGAHFGAAVADSAQLSLIVGAPGDGTATIFEPVEPGTTWQIGGILTPPGLTRAAAVAAGFGVAVTIEVAFGFKFAAVGAPNADGAGAMYSYVKPGSSWIPGQRFVDNPRTPGGRFGQSIGNEAGSGLIGEPGIDAVVGFTFDPPSGAITSLGRDVGGSGFGNAVGVGGARAVAADPTVRAVYVYGRGTTQGALLGTLLPTSGAANDGFGAAVAVNGAAVVGAPGAQAIHIFDLGTTDVLDESSVTLSRPFAYAASGVVFGDISVTRAGHSVVAVVGRGRLVTGAATPPPFVAFDLHQIHASPLLAGSVTIRDPIAGFVHTFLVLTTARAVSPTRVTGIGLALEPSAKGPRVGFVQWSVNDRAT